MSPTHSEGYGVVKLRRTQQLVASWWPISQAQQRYGISTNTVRRLIAEELIEARKVGDRVLINDDSMSRYMFSLPRAVIKPDDRSAKLVGRVVALVASK